MEQRWFHGQVVVRPMGRRICGPTDMAVVRPTGRGREGYGQPTVRANGQAVMRANGLAEWAAGRQSGLAGGFRVLHGLLRWLGFPERVRQYVEPGGSCSRIRAR